jgi:hypothetical protein
VVLVEKGDAYNKEGKKIIASIEREKYIIDIIVQDEAENTLDDLYQVLAKLMYKEATAM